MSPLASRPLVPRITLVVCACVAVAIALQTEARWRADRVSLKARLVAQAREITEQLASTIDAGVIDPAAERLLRAPRTKHGGGVEAIQLIDRRGTITWSTRADEVGHLMESPNRSAPAGATEGWVGYLLDEGTWGAVSAGGSRLRAIAAVQAGTAGPAAPRAVVVTWDLTNSAAARSERYLRDHATGLLFSLIAGLLLWLALRHFIAGPMERLAREAARIDLAPEDLVSYVQRDDELSLLARAMSEARGQLRDSRRELDERAARLSGAIDATADGVVLATLRDGHWVVDHVNARFAAMCGRPIPALEGRTVEEGLDSLAERLIEGGAVRAWIKRTLADPNLEDSRPGTMRPQPAGENAEAGLLLLDVLTRPVRDETGRPFGRLWLVRDVTRERTHESRLKRQNQELAAIDLVGRRVSRSLDRSAILASALETLREVTDSPYAVVVLAEPGGDAGTVEAQSPIRAALAVDLPSLRAGEIILLPDVTCRPELLAALPRQVDSLLGLPLLDTAGLVAVLVLGRPRADGFSNEEVTLLRRIVHPVDAALENARLFARSEAQLAENQTLIEVSRSVGCADTLEAVLEDILRVIHVRLQYRNAAILLPDESGKTLYIRASVGFHNVVGAIRLPIDGSAVTARALRTGVLVNVPDVRVDPGYVAGSDDIRSELAIPLRFGERVLGVLDIESEHLGAFDDDDERLLASVATQAAMVLQNAHLLVETRSRAMRFEAVNEIARAVASTLDPRSLDRAIVSQIARVVPCERYAMLHYDHEARRVTRTVALDPRVELAHDGDDLSWTFEEGLDPAGLVAHRAQWFPDASVVADRAEVRHVAQGLASLVVVPIALDGEIAASIVAASAKPHGFSGEQIQLLETVSYHVGVALKNAQLFARLQDSYTQLDEAQDGLVRSEKLRALGEMASGVAHDFNNVLGAILGRAQLLKLAVGKGELADELDIIEKAAQDGAATVRRLQDFTRVRTDRGFQSLSMTQIVTDCLSLTRGRWRDEAEHAGIRYDLVADLAPMPPVAGEASELREVVTNMILNALDAMPGGGMLRFMTRHDAAAGEVHLEVGDTGAGMSDEVRARIFDPFFTTKGVRGVGLGLSVVYGIIQRHGGRIEVASTTGSGTTMRIVLPVALTLPAAGGDSPRLREAPPGAAGPVLRVLVVDDEPGVRSLLADLLRVDGHEAIEAASGREALARLTTPSGPAATPFDLVLTDLGMPDMSGWDVARAVGELADPPPVVLVTGWGIQLDDTLLTASGVADVIAKPFTLEEVLAVVRRAAARRAA